MKRTQALRMLSRESFLRARDFIFENGGEIDRAWYRYHFEDASTDEILAVLGGYQHENGGFGGLWHEFEYDGPCLKSTEIAVRYLLGLRELPPESPMIRRMCAYLLENFLSGTGNFREVVVPAVNDGVHCHWSRWRGEDESPIFDENERVRRYHANEKACFAAILAKYPALVPEHRLREILRCPVEHLLRHWDQHSAQYLPEIFASHEPYDLEYYQILVPCLPDAALRSRAAAILCQNPMAFLELDPEKSDHDYVHLACDAVDSPENVLYPAIADAVEVSLSHRIGQQAADGRWPLGWFFGDSPGLRALQTKYEAFRTLGMLIKCYNFGRIQ